MKKKKASEDSTRPSKKKSWWRRFLDHMAEVNEKEWANICRH